MYDIIHKYFSKDFFFFMMHARFFDFDPVSITGGRKKIPFYGLTVTVFNKYQCIIQMTVAALTLVTLCIQVCL